MLDKETIEYFSFEGARILLSPFRHTGIPSEPQQCYATLQPTIRALWESSQRGGRNLYEIGAQLRLAADLFASHLHSPPPGALKNFPQASSPAEMPDILREIADHVEGWSAGYVTKLAAAVPTSWELKYRFPVLNSMLENYFSQIGIATDSDELSAREALQLYIDDTHTHPICLWRLPQISAECHAALAIFQDGESLRQFFELDHGLGSWSLPWSEWIALIAEVAETHLKQHHPPRWQRSAR